MVTALEGLKIVSFEWIVVGPLSTSYLAQQGATVVKVESHVRPDGGRFVAPFKDGIVSPDRSGFFFHQNTSKYSVSINVKKPAGKAVIEKLIKWADVVVENMTPGVMKNLDLDYQAARTINPGIIYVSISIQGQYGPHYRATGYGQLAAALAGCSHLAGWPDRGPAPPHGAYVDFITARFVPCLILAAIDYRNRTGKGQYIDNSILENTAYFFSLPVMDYVVNNRVMNRSGNRHPSACPHGVFKCKGNDRWVAIAIFTDAEWQAFCSVTKKTQWVDDNRFHTFVDRKKNEDELERQINEWTIDYTPEEVEGFLQKAGVQAGHVESNSDLFRDSHLKETGFFKELNHPVIGPTAHVGIASNYSRTKEIQFPAPILGEHNQKVLKKFLGMSDDDIANLYVEGAITTEADFPF